MNGKNIINSLSVEYGISVDRVLAYMRDRASTNEVSIRPKVLYPNVLDIGCFSHTIDNTGGHFRTPSLSSFGSASSLVTLIVGYCGKCSQKNPGPHSARQGGGPGGRFVIKLFVSSAMCVSSFSPTLRCHQPLQQSFRCC